MSDDKSKRGPDDRRKVSSIENYEVEYEAKKKGTTPEKIREAIRHVGNSREKIEQWLKDNP